MVETNLTLLFLWCGASLHIIVIMYMEEYYRTATIDMYHTVSLNKNDMRALVILTLLGWIALLGLIGTLKEDYMKHKFNSNYQ